MILDLTLQTRGVDCKPVLNLSFHSAGLSNILLFHRVLYWHYVSSLINNDIEASLLIWPENNLLALHILEDNGSSDS